MIKTKGLFTTCRLDAVISMLIRSETKRFAVELARYKLHPANFLLEQMYFHDGNGRKHLFHLTVPDKIDWKKAEMTEESGVFQVYADLCVEMKVPVSNEFHEEYVRYAELKIPASRLIGKPVLVIPGPREPLFIQVESHRLEWKESRNKLYILK
ncbi:hypothetical protein [Paenibacillus gansuensis]|uniref:Uncharacterized protein n=1 Tax=Paenibacillus gansuensis TaxID=306542 RepID=A0ABW5PAB8_9BACL